MTPPQQVQWSEMPRVFAAPGLSFLVNARREVTIEVTEHHDCACLSMTAHDDMHNAVYAYKTGVFSGFTMGNGCV